MTGVGTESQDLGGVRQDGGRPVLSVRNVCVAFESRGTVTPVVRDVSFDIHIGETLCLVGESGSGKSLTALAIMGLLPQPGARVTAGEILFQGCNLAGMADAELRHVRGKHIAMVFQDPLTALNPVVTVGRQIALAIAVHERRTSKRAIQSRVVELLRKVGVPDAERCFRRYPHEYSGGMRQRVVIAMAMANQPRLIIADEPTTALDVTVQAQVLEALAVAREETGASTLLITHDLGVVAEQAQDVCVMYAGRIVEQADVFGLFKEPQHPYTVGLLSTIARAGEAGGEIRTIPGQPADPRSLPTGCAFHPRCAIARDSCAREVPALVATPNGHLAACPFGEDVSALAHRLIDADPTSSGGALR